MISTPKFRRLEARDFEDVAVLFAELAGEAVSVDIGPYMKTLEFQGTLMFGVEVDCRVVSMATLHILPNLAGTRLA